MAAIDHTPSAPHGIVSHVEHAAHAAINAVFAPLRRWVEYRQITEELSGYSDRNLRDIGIGRCEIERIAREGASEV